MEQNKRNMGTCYHVCPRVETIVPKLSITVRLNLVNDRLNRMVESLAELEKSMGEGPCRRGSVAVVD